MTELKDLGDSLDSSNISIEMFVRYQTHNDVWQRVWRGVSGLVPFNLI